MRKAAGERQLHFFDATRAAEAIFANAIAANMFMLGFAAQKGGLPLSCRGDRTGDQAERPGRGDEYRAPSAGAGARRTIRLRSPT